MSLIFKDTSSEGFIDIYNDMTLQFPPIELKSFEQFKIQLSNDNYKLLAISDSNIKIGYTLFYECNNNIWIDYIAIFKQFHSKGYGSLVFEQMKTNFRNTKGCYLEVEKLNPNDINTQRRIKFYKNLGAKKLKIEYLYPTKSGNLPMDLYYMPFDQSKCPNQKENLKTIKQIFDTIHCEISHKDTVYNEICKLNKFHQR